MKWVQPVSFGSLTNQLKIILFLVQTSECQCKLLTESCHFSTAVVGGMWRYDACIEMNHSFISEKRPTAREIQNVKQRTHNYFYCYTSEWRFHLMAPAFVHGAFSMLPIFKRESSLLSACLSKIIYRRFETNAQLRL